MKIFARRVVVALVLAFVSASPATAAPRALEAYADRFFGPPRAGATREAFDFLGETFVANGASIRARTEGGRFLDLKVLPFTEIVNSFDNGPVTINVAAMPTAAQAEAYWANWNRVLANGRWNYRKFFRDAREMQTLARYNALVLTAHEYGHYFDYRYNVSGYEYGVGGVVTKKALNCTEYLADKFAVAVINYLSQERRFAALRPRYYALINDINRSLPAQNRMQVHSFRQLETDCDSVDIRQNGVSADGSVNVNFFRNYASAYFGRHRVLLDYKKFPTLPNLIRQTLTSRLPARAAYSGHKVSIRPAGAVRVLRETTDLAFGPRGDLWQFAIEKTPSYGKTASLSIKVRDASGKQQAAFGYEFPAEQRIGLDAGTPIVFSDSALLIPFQNDPSADLRFDKLPDKAYFLMAQRQKDKSWKTVFVQVPKLPHSVHGDSYYSWAPTPSGNLILLHHVSGRKENATFSYDVKATDLSLTSRRLVRRGSHASAASLVNDRHEFFATVQDLGDFNNGVVVRTVTPTLDKIVIGSGLDGAVLHPDKTRVQLASISARRFLNNTTLRVACASTTDPVTRMRRYLIRDITIKPPAK